MRPPYQTYRPRARLDIDVLKFGSRTEAVTLSPRIIELKWTRNHHLAADEATVTIGWKESGVDPRALKNARGAIWVWDDNDEFDRVKHLRFTGMAKKVSRRSSEEDRVVDITFHDYTTLFIHNKPLKTSGMPEWTDTLEQVWTKICDNTGWQDPNTGKILSSVEALRDKLVFLVPELRNVRIGDIEANRFHAISAPTPPQGASSWDVWMWVISSLGLVSYIDRDQCIVTNTTEHFPVTAAPFVTYGKNIRSLEETVDTDITLKGVLVKSFDTLNGRVMEAFYPPPGDERLKARQAAVRPRSEEGTKVTANEQSADYEEFGMWSIHDQAQLDRTAQAVYDIRSRQEMEGSFKTAEMVLESRDESKPEGHDILDLRAGELIAIELDPEIDRDALVALGGEEARVQYLVERCDYDEDVARLIAKNIDTEFLRSIDFHIKTVELTLGPEQFEVEIKFHNLIIIKDGT